MSNRIFTSPSFAHLVLALTGGAGLLASGCSAAPGAESTPPADDVSGREDAFVNQVVFPADSGCNATQKYNIMQAATEAYERLFVDPAPLRECLKDAILSPDNGVSPEAILKVMRADMPTQMRCVDSSTTSCGGDFGWNACAGIGTSGEGFSWDEDYAEEGDVTKMAGTLLHEIAHNKGFWHLDGTEYGFSVNAQIARCVRSEEPGGARRSEVPGEVELAKAGGSGGSPFRLACPVGAYVTSVSWAEGDRVAGIGVMCGYRNGNKAPSPAGVSSNTKEGIWLFDLPESDAFVTGITGYADQYVSSLGRERTMLANLEEGGGGDDYDHKIPADPASGEAFRRRCPPGMAVTEIRGRSGDWIDEIRVVCQDVRIDHWPSGFTKLDAVGSTSGLHGEDHRCMGLGVMVGLYGRSGDLVDRLGGVCETLTETASGAARDASFRHVFSASGGRGGDELDDRCPSSKALVGLSVRSGAKVDQVRGICADIAARKQGDEGVSFLSSHGGSGGDLDVLTCPKYQFLVGFESWTASPKPEGVLHGIRPICRSVPADGGI